MKNSLVKIISVLLCVCFVFGASACNKKTGQQKTTFGGGVHDFTAPEIADKYLVKDGKSDYKIILPQESTDVERVARDEFNTLLKEATGITLGVERDQGRRHDGGKYISLGETSMLASSGIELPKRELGMDGLIIVTKGDTVYLCGGTSYGTVYAVYDFMSIMFNYEYYFTDCIVIDKDVKDAKLRNFNVKDIPDFALRCANYGFISNSSGYAGYRYREPYGYGNLQLPIHPNWAGSTDEEKAQNRENRIVDKRVTGYTAHNTLRGYVPKEQYSETHPGWYSSRGRQICYTAHGDENELELLAQECAMKIEASLKAYTPKDWPLRNTATITIEDNPELCACDACAASKAKYGTDSAACIILTNKINKYVRAWMALPENAEYYRDDFEILFFAYSMLIEAPSTANKKGVYEPNAPELRCDDGVSVWLAPINTDYEKDFYVEENAGYRENFEKWASISDKIYMWNYSTNFTQMMYFYDSFSFYNTESYQFMRANGGYMNFNQAQGGQQGVATGFHTLKAYIDAKLAWNTSLDSGKLIDDWFDAMYREAAPAMKELFTQMRLHKTKLNNELNISGVYQKIDNKNCYPIGVLEKQMAILDDAFAVIDKYGSLDPEQYAVLKAHIETEWLSPAYIMLTLYADEISPVELTTLRSVFKERALRLGLTRAAENSGLISDFVKADLL